MKFVRFSRKRRRTYARVFDYDEARRRVAAGESMSAVARDMGVDRRSVNRAIHEVDLTVESAPDEIEGYTKRGTRTRFKVGVNALECPTCHGPKFKDSELCRPCRADHRLKPPSLRTLSGRNTRTMLGGVEFGRIVSYRGRWAVVEDGGPRFRWLHFWDGPPQRVRVNVVVDSVLPSKVFA